MAREKYDSTRDFILVRRKSGDTVLVPPDGSLMLPCEYENFENAHKAVRAVIADDGEVWLFEHDHPAALQEAPAS